MIHLKRIKILWKDSVNRYIATIFIKKYQTRSKSLDSLQISVLLLVFLVKWSNFSVLYESSKSCSLNDCSKIIYHFQNVKGYLNLEGKL